MSTTIEVIEEENLIIVETSTGPPGPPGSNLSDGDKGDINVSAFGSSWVIKSSAVTLAKMAPINNSILLGRATAGTGAVEALSAASVRTILNVANGATANSTDATLLARANHTGTQSADTIVDGSTNHVFTAADDTKLAGIATGATANSADATLLARANHTGTQTASTISDFSEAVDDRVATLLVEGTGINLTYNDATGTLTIDSTGGGGTGVTDGDKGDITVSGTGVVWTIDNDAVTLAKIQNIATDSLLGRDTASTGDPEVITVTGGIEFSGSGSIRTSAFTGDVTKTAGGTALTIANDAVTYAKIQNVSVTQRLLGRNTAGAGDVEELDPATIRTMINVANGATANSSDATLLARANHTGTQAISTITNLQTTLDAKVDENAGGFVAIGSLHPGTTVTVRKDPTTGFWPASYTTAGAPVYTGGSANAGVRPTSRTDVVVQWKGADPSPAIVSSGTGGMIDNIDLRLVTA